MLKTEENAFSDLGSILNSRVDVYLSVLDYYGTNRVGFVRFLC